MRLINAINGLRSALEIRYPDKYSSITATLSGFYEGILVTSFYKFDEETQASIIKDVEEKQKKIILETMEKTVTHPT